MDFRKTSVVDLSQRIRRRELSPTEAVTETFAAIRLREPQLHAFISLAEEQAFARARDVEHQMASGGKLGVLAGVPVAIKDNCCTKGIVTTCGSRMLEDFVPTYSAVAVERLEAAGAIVVGKTNMDEFAMGSTTETSVFGATKNPWDLSRVPGGSSGGSAAAVAAGLVPCALGSDTGGSIRLPAAHCGVVGIKPTYGRVSRRGLIAYASSLDQIGPIAGDVRDCATLLEVLSGWDAGDSTSVKREDSTTFTASLKQEIAGLRVGIPREWLEAQLEESVRQGVLLAASYLEAQGARVELFSLKDMEYAVPAYYVIACGEAASNLARYDGIRYGFRANEFENLQELYCRTRSGGFGAEVKRRILCGNFVLSAGFYDAYYRKALQARAKMQLSFDRAFASFDILLSPVAPTTAPLLGESLRSPMDMYLQDVFTVAVNLAGLPAMSVPCTPQGASLPVGVQLIANRWQEETLLRAGYALEQARGSDAFSGVCLDGAEKGGV